MNSVALKQPKALTVLFLTEMWERFSFYGMRSLLVLYIVQQLNWKEASAYKTLGAYAALIYLGGIVGGLVADRLLGFRRAIILGGIIITCGHFTLAFEHPLALFVGLGLIVCGTGLFKSNITTLLGEFYTPDDPRREAGFSIFYLGINLGSFLAFLACGYVAKRWGWHLAFSLAGFGMLVGLTIFLIGGKHLEGKGETPCPKRLKKSFLGIRFSWCIYLTAFMVAGLVAFLIHQNHWLAGVLPIVGGITLGYALYIAFTGPLQVRYNIFSLLVLMFFMLLFLAFWEQQASSLTLFVENHVNRSAHWLDGWLGIAEIPAPWFASFNPLSIIVFANIVGFIWFWLATHHKPVFAPMKFVIAFVFLSGAFYLLAWVAKNAPQGELLNMKWIALFYVLYTIGELCIMPVGFSMVTKLAPSDSKGFFMGAWFMGIAFAEYIAAWLAQLTTTDDNIGVSAPMYLYGDFFETLAIWGIGAAVVLSVLSYFMRPVFDRIECH